MTYRLDITREICIGGIQVHADHWTYVAETLDAAQHNSLLPQTAFEWTEPRPDHFEATVEVVKDETVKRWVCVITPE